MSKERFDRLFQYVDLIRWVLYTLVAGAVATAVWSTKIQMTLNDIENHVNSMEQNSAIHRDAIKEKDTQNEHRFTMVEKDVEWLREEKHHAR